MRYVTKKIFLLGQKYAGHETLIKQTLCNVPYVCTTNQYIVYVIRKFLIYRPIIRRHNTDVSDTRSNNEICLYN